VRVAIGARGAHLWRLVLRDAAQMALAGTAIGAFGGSCCVGTGRLAPFRGGALAADSRATRSAIQFSRFRRFEPLNCASSVGSDVLPLSTPRDSRHEGRGGSAWELPRPASVRRSVMRASSPR
jgi:hypothetical protein